MCHKGPAVRQSDRTGVWTQGLLTTSTKRDYTDIVYIAYSLYSCYGYHTCGTSQGPAMAHWHTVSAYKGYVTEGLHVFILLGFTLKLFTNNENHHPVPSCTYTHTHTHTHPWKHYYTNTFWNRKAQSACAESTNKRISAWKMLHKQQRPELPMVIFTWHASNYKVHKLHQRYIFDETSSKMYLW